MQSQNLCGGLTWGFMLGVYAYPLSLLADGVGAGIEARDTIWDSTPLDWAMVGSGERPQGNPEPDWVATVRLLIGAGASTWEVTLSPDDLKPPSAAVAAILRAVLGSRTGETTARSDQ